MFCNASQYALIVVEVLLTKRQQISYKKKNTHLFKHIIVFNRLPITMSNTEVITTLAINGTHLKGVEY